MSELGDHPLWTPDELARFNDDLAALGNDAGGDDDEVPADDEDQAPAQRINFWRSRRYRGIECFWGPPGSGKTYELAAWGLAQQSEGRPLYCSYGFELPGSIPFRSIEEFVSIPNGSAVCVDEAPIWFDARAWASMDPVVLVRLTQVRHYDIQLRYTAIHPSMVELRLRQITFTFWEHRALVGPWNLRRRSKSPEGAPKLRTEDGGWRLRRMRSEVASAYDTTADADVTEWAVERERKSRKGRR